jgi:hypothetical protein
MSNLAKMLWLAAITAICGIGLFLANPRSDQNANKGVVLAQPKLSLALLEARLRAAYPDFCGIRSIQIGLAHTTSSPTVELRVIDGSRNNYVCLVTRIPGGWTIEQIRRVKVPPAGRLI